MKARFLFVLLVLLVHNGISQKVDTIVVNERRVNTKVLKEGTNRYLVYFKLQKDSVRTQTQFWTRTINRSVYEGVPVIEVSQIWEDKDSIMHIVKSICDAETMKPLYHKTWWKVQTARNSSTKSVTETIVDFKKNSIVYNGYQISDQDTGRQYKAIWNAYKSSNNKYFLNWHLDLEVFPVLPYKKGVTFIIPFYDPGLTSGLREVSYTVTGSDKLTGYDGQQIDCWLMTHESPGNKEVFWVSKKTKEVLKLEQEINGRLYRYKIKLGFSN